MDINFNCPRCGQNIAIDEKGAGTTVECPSCNAQISVPATPSAKPSPLSRSSVVTPAAASAAASDPAITRRSGWSSFLKVIGVICLVGGGLGFFAALSEGRNDSASNAFICIVIGIGGAIQSFFFAFLIDVFTDIRWFIKKLVDARNA